jgi:hypothetical protein
LTDETTTAITDIVLVVIAEGRGMPVRKSDVVRKFLQMSRISAPPWLCVTILAKITDVPALIENI